MAMPARRAALGALFALLSFASGTHAALSESNGNNPYTISPAVSVGSSIFFTVQLRNNGASTVNVAGLSVTGPFTIAGGNCGESIPAGAVCNGNIALVFTPPLIGNAAGTLVVANDSAEGAFTLNLAGTGTALSAPTMTAALAPNAIHANTGVSTLTFTLGNPNSSTVSPLFFNLNLPSGIQAAPSPNAGTTCGGGAWFGPGNSSPAGQSFVYYSGTNPAPVIATQGSCTIFIDVVSTNAPGSYPVTVMPDGYSTREVWSAVAANATLTVLAPTPGAPGAPVITSATGANALATVMFSAPSVTGSTPISGYTVTSKPAGGVDANAGSTALSHAITGLANGTSYTFTVAASNAAGPGPPSLPSSAVIPATVPGVPLFTIATAGNAQALVTFSPPAVDGGRAVTGYVVTSSPPGGVDTNAGSTVFSHKVTGLSNGVAYTFTVAASNGVGAGAPSAASKAVTPAIASPPVALRQVTYQVRPTRTAIAAATPVVPPGPRVLSYALAYNAPRSFAYADFNGDGWVDIFFAPGYSQHPPFIPGEIWLNNGDATFRNGTAEAIDGPSPLTNNPTDIFVADWNGDGRPDLFLSQTGIEQAVVDGDPNAGATSILLLSQPDGRLKDVSSQIVANPRAFTHTAGIGDYNADGNLDFVVNHGGVESPPVIDGIALNIGDGHGNFAETAQGLSQDIAYMSNALRVTSDRQPTGCTALADLDGDGRADVIAGGYGNPDQTLRFYRSLPNGTAPERSRVDIPDALAGIVFVNVPHGGTLSKLGCSQILPADLNGDGRLDLVIEWEGDGLWYIEILRNDGNFQFTDITLEALGSYSVSFGVDGPNAGPGKIKLLDLNGDGTLDLVYSFNATSILNILRHVAMLNDGTARFSAWTPLGPQGLLGESDIMPVALCGSCTQLMPIFTRMADGRLPSLIFDDSQTDLTNSVPTQTKTVYLTVVEPVAMPSVPGAPTISVATAGDGQAIVTFTAPKSNGGSVITGYTVSSSRGDGQDLQAGSLAMSHVIAGLVNGTAYTFTVKAHNTVGTGLSSAASRAVTPLGGFTLTVAKSGIGTGAVNSDVPGIDCGSTCAFGFIAGTLVTLTASPAIDSLFSGWSGACTGTGACTVNLTQDQTVTATFALSTTRLVNLSTRGQVQTGDNVMIGGFIIGGATPKKVLIRAVGPTLAQYQVSGVLLDPTLQLFSGQTVIASNDDWQTQTTPSDVAAITASTLAPSDLKESAILTTLNPGAYTAIVSGNGGGTGVGIVEVYELDHPEIPLINISTRGQVQTGDNVMIGGFIIQGDSAKTVLIRAVGPNLLNHGVTGVLANPKLQLFSGQALVAENDDWGSATNKTEIEATGLAPASALESAILITLPPGAYTAIVSGAEGGSGVGIIEVFAQ